MTKTEYIFRLVGGVVVCLMTTIGLINPVTPSSIGAYIFVNILAFTLYLNYLTLVIQIRAIHADFGWLLDELKAMVDERNQK